MIIMNNELVKFGRGIDLIDLRRRKNRCKSGALFEKMIPA